MVISKKVLADFVTVREAKARLDELQALRPYLTTDVYKKRKSLLLNKIESLENPKSEEKIVINFIVRE
jgi:hypothetical protein